MSLTSRLIALSLAFALALLAGCTRYHKEAPVVRAPGTVYEATRYHAQLRAPDGTKIRFTVWQPSLRQGQTAPLILHAHGIALTRMDAKLDTYPLFLMTGKAAYRAWERGYWVISFDQRGHGASGGKIGLMEWDKEVADVSLIIDWAQKNLAISEINGDPRVGMVGESYGGGVQLLASVRDPRIDALVPVTTWYDLEDAIIPNGVPKSDWALFLGVASYAINPFHMDGRMTMQMAKEILIDDPQPELRNKLRRNSLAFHCEGGTYPQADALLIQGFRDVVFPVNHAIAARDCFVKGGRDARLIGVEHGHLAPTAQLPPIRPGSLPIWHIDRHVRCDGRTYDLQDVIYNWFELKLRDRKIPDSAVPHWCLTGDRAVDAIQATPEPMVVDVAHVHVGSGAAGLVEWIARPMESAKNWFVPNRMPADWAKPRNGWLRPARVPLLKISGPTWIVGSPQLEIDVDEADRGEPILFVRMAKWKPGSGNYQVLSQQVTPVHGKGHLTVRMNAVRARLEKGEILGLLVNGYSNQFRMAGSGWGTDAGLSGTIALPLAGAAP